MLAEQTATDGASHIFTAPEFRPVFEVEVVKSVRRALSHRATETTGACARASQRFDDLLAALVPDDAREVGTLGGRGRTRRCAARGCDKG